MKLARTRMMPFPARWWDEDFRRLFSAPLPEAIDTEGFGEMADWKPALDLQETDRAFEVTVDLPGVDPEDIDVEFDNGMLSIKGQRETEERDDGNGYQRVERFTGTFLRRLALPDVTEPDKIKARTENGVLKVTLPKAETHRTRRIPIDA